MLYREPKVLKDPNPVSEWRLDVTVSVLYREPKVLKAIETPVPTDGEKVSVLYREPKVLKAPREIKSFLAFLVSVLYREPKVLKVTSLPEALPL